MLYNKIYTNLKSHDYFFETGLMMFVCCFTSLMLSVSVLTTPKEGFLQACKTFVNIFLWMGSSVLMIVALFHLKREKYRLVKYFWLFITPGLNFLMYWAIVVDVFVRSMIKLFMSYVEAYKAQSGKETVVMLEDILKNTKKTNAHIMSVKNSTDVKVSKLTLDIIKESRILLDNLGCEK